MVWVRYSHLMISLLVSKVKRKKKGKTLKKPLIGLTASHVQAGTCRLRE